MPLYEPPPAPPRVLYHAAYAILGAAMLAGLMAALYAFAFVLHAMVTL